MSNGHMSTFNQETYTNLKKIFTDVTKKIGNYKVRELPTDPIERKERIKRYCEELVIAYNNFVVYLKIFYNRFDLQSQFKANQLVIEFKQKIKKSLEILGLGTNEPDNFELINLDSIVNIGDETLKGLDNTELNQSKSNSFGEKVITSTPTAAQATTSANSNTPD